MDEELTPESYGFSGFVFALGSMSAIFVGSLFLLTVFLGTSFGSNSPLTPLLVIPANLPALVSLLVCLMFAWRLQLSGRGTDARSLLTVSAALAFVNFCAVIAVASFFGHMLLFSWPL